MKIGFIASNRDTSIGSYRIWIRDLNDYFKYCGIDSRICNNSHDIEESPVLICSKGDFGMVEPLKNRYPDKKIGIVNLAADKRVAADFIIVGSLEEKDSLSHHKNVFLFPLIERLTRDHPAKKHQYEENLSLVFHGSYTHLSKFDPHLKAALEELEGEGEINFNLKIITSDAGFDWKVGRPNIKNIKMHQWQIDTICKEISECDIGLVPNLTTLSEKHLETNCPPVMGLYSTDYAIRFKNKSNAGRSFVFHQLGIPVVSDLTPSNFHILGNPDCGLIAHSKLGWKKSILSLVNHNERNRISLNAKKEFDRLYDPHIWAARLYKEIMEIS